VQLSCTSPTGKDKGGKGNENFLSTTIVLWKRVRFRRLKPFPTMPAGKLRSGERENALEESEKVCNDGVTRTPKEGGENVTNEESAAVTQRWF
jgi:hypothetical protein